MSKKISELTAATTPLAGTELVEIVQSGTSKKVEASYLSGAGGGREMLTADRTYYVRTDGSDSNNGLANTSGGAFLTIQKAVDVAYTLDTNKYIVTIQVADGTYTGAVSIAGSLTGGGALLIQGNTTTPGNVLISVTSNNCFTITDRATVTLKGLKFTTTTSGWAVVSTRSSITTLNKVEFGACVGGHMYLDTLGTINASGDYAINGSAPVHVQSSGGSILFWQRTVTLTGTPAFSTAFILASSMANIFWGGGSFSGTATGKRYEITLNSVVNSSGGGTSYYPGSVAGTTATGGQYA